MAGEERILSVQSQRSDQILDRVRVHFDAPVVEEDAQSVPVIEQIGDGATHRALRRQPLRLGAQEGGEFVDEGTRRLLPNQTALPAKAGQKTTDGYYNLERMLRRALSASGRVLMCGTCMDARGLSEGDMMEGAMRSSMDELAEATLAADKVLVF
jgi:hypothetical protein